MVPLLCTVRECALPLAREERRWLCAKGHSFDIARSGYTNLLQPQDRRSSHPGDSADAVAARRRFVDARHDAAIVQRIVEIATPLATGPILDAGCGDGHYLGAMHVASCGEADGVDISVPAIDAAAKRHRDCRFVVANADRFLPYANHSFALVTSITARVNPEEFRRVVRDDGALLVALPAPDDLLELRAAVLGSGEECDRSERTIESLRGSFALVSRERVTQRVTLDHAAMLDVMTSSYRGLRLREQEKLAQLTSMDVTLSRDVLVFR